MESNRPLEPIDQYVADVAAKLRITNNLSYEDFANILDVPVSFILEAEHKASGIKYNLIHINILAEYFKVSPRYFLPKDSLPERNDSIN